MIRSVGRLTQADPGFDPSGVLTVQFSLVGEAYREDAAVLAFQRRLLERVAALPQVESAALAGQIPMGGNGDSWGFYVEGREANNRADTLSVERYSVTPGYFTVMRIPLLRGRLLDDRDSEDALPVIVVSAATARLVWGDEDPIGRRVKIGGRPGTPWRTVVGVAGDVRHQDLTEAPRPQMYLPQAQLTDSFLVLTLRADARPDALAGAVRAFVRELDPAVPVYDVARLDDLVAKSFADRRFVMRLLSAFAALALVLAAVGLYGVIAYVVSQRTREVGIRLALGATRSHIVRLVFGAGVRSIAVGVLFGLAGALLVSRALGFLLFGVGPADPVSLAAAAAVLAAVTAAAHLVPLANALGVDPAAALRTD
jgi:putative ABC transport system permease protein